MAYLGSTPEYQSFTSGTDYFNGDGISVAFTLSRPVASVNDIEVVISNVVQQPSTAYTVSGTTITFTSAPPAGTSNVYARYMSTATQTITPSPGTVGTSQISPSLTNVPFFGGSTIGAGNATGMKNRIINGGMVLDQYNAGASVTISTGTFVVDRWNVYLSNTATMTGQGSTIAPRGFTNSLSVTVTSGAATSSTAQSVLRQKIEGYNVADFGWGTVNAKTVTLSFWVRSSLTGTFGVAFRNQAGNRAYIAAYTISSANTFEYKTIVVSGDTTGAWTTDNTTGLQILWDLGVGTTYSQAAGSWTSSSSISGLLGGVKLAETTGATFYVTGVQLEEGNAATSFEFRSYGTELALAQRYYYRIFPAAGNKLLLSAGSFFTGSVASLSGNFPVSMRVAPSALEQSGTAGNYLVNQAGFGGAICTSVPAFAASTVDAFQITGTSTGALFTAGYPSTFYTSSPTGANAFLGWSAEL